MSKYKLVDWIDIEKIDWLNLSFNKNNNISYILEKNQGKINWYNLSMNINAISIEKILFPIFLYHQYF